MKETDHENTIKFEYTLEQLYAIVRKLENVPDDVSIEVSIVDGPMTKDGEWISNIGRNEIYLPDSLSRNAYIEVKYRNGSFDVGEASDWRSPWRETDKHARNIVAYRVIKK